MFCAVELVIIAVKIPVTVVPAVEDAAAEDTGVDDAAAEEAGVEEAAAEDTGVDDATEEEELELDEVTLTQTYTPLSLLIFCVQSEALPAGVHDLPDV